MLLYVTAANRAWSSDTCGSSSETTLAIKSRTNWFLRVLEHPPSDLTEADVSIINTISARNSEHGVLVAVVVGVVVVVEVGEVVPDVV